MSGRTTAVLMMMLLASAATLAVNAHASVRPFKVVIDPGHGGSDRGAVTYDGPYAIAEKDLTLLLAHQVAYQLQAAGIDVTLTRRDDRELPLGRRTELANRLGADIFLSIHMNSSRSRGPAIEGFETYILNNATDATSRRLAHLENTVISHDGIRTSEQEDVALILRDMRLDANLAESKRLACGIQDAMVPAAVARDRGVKQALFHVLLGADMPSVLVEAGFISSPRDRALVLSPRGRKRIAASIAGAIQQYRALKGTRAATRALSRCRVH